MRTFDKYSSFVKLPYFIGVAVFAFWLNHPAALAALFLTQIVNISLNGKVLERLKLALPLGLFCVLINALTNHSGVTKLFRLPWGNSVTLESIAVGISVAATVSSLLMSFSFFSTTVSFNELLELTKTRLPKLTALAALSFRFLPMWSRRMLETARYAERFSDDKPLKRAGNVLSSTIAGCAEQSIITSRTMSSRGFSSTKLARRKNKLRRDEIVCLVFESVSCAALCFFAAFGSLRVYYTPVYAPVNGIKPIVLPLILYAAFLFIPAAVRVKEELIWKLSK